MGNLCGKEKAAGKARETPAPSPASKQQNGQVISPKPTGAGLNTNTQQPGAASTSGGASPKRVAAINNVLGSPTEDVQTLYTLGKVLGKGQFGTTRLAEEKSTGRLLACKSISKRKLTTAEDIEDVRREVQIMHHLKGHENICLLHAAYEDKHHVHLVMELASGGELFDRIVARGHYSEKSAAAIVRTIVSVVAHCHSLGVMHRDLKPENFLLADKSENAPLKATDFGLSVFYRPGQVFTDIVGSAYYVAPEVLRRHYTAEADIWSCGIILYILLSGVPPFWGETENQIFNAILKGKLDFQSDPWPHISQGAKDCVQRMLQHNPKHRATAIQILQHEWMRENGTASERPLNNVILQRMRVFANHNMFKKKALQVIASTMNAEEIAGLRSLFQALDADKNGSITVEELREGMARQGSKVSQVEIQQLLAQMDADQSGTIDYEEFLAATVNQAQLERKENMVKAFEFFDTDRSGFITVDELEQALQKHGVNDAADIQQIMKEVDKDGNGRIDYNEFCDMMRGTGAPSLANATAASSIRKGAY
ncbi:hypothetical protein WJX84_007746 [Apatococcus fuscideae]|uniref:non-specific serine/threonine protein kinase n=1 Tax=Apatococcus fuscideae TaxID=2026836 RepID=A0AAW1SV23_9CHLO